MSRCAELNRGPHPYHGCALPTELQRQFRVFYFVLWAGRDLNPRSPKTSDLQSDAFDHSATYPYFILLCLPRILTTSSRRRTIAHLFATVLQSDAFDHSATYPYFILLYCYPEPSVGLEPTTDCLQNNCSTN